jgi:lipopolysaccharide/colanic/teichoic acid biosynthesis glycosyltransferase
LTREALEIADAPPAWRKASGGVAARAGLEAAVAVLAFLACFIVAPNIYAYFVILATHRTPPPGVYLHIVANCCANVLVVLGSWSARGPLYEKLRTVFGATLWAHGLLALVIVLTHSVYSNRVMIPAVAVSLVLGLIAAVASHLVTRVRVAVVGPQDELADQISPYAEHVAEPDADLRRYDLVLTTFAGEVPADWTKALSRAMLAGKRVRHASEYLEEARGHVLPEHFDLDQLPEGGFASYETGKRAMDIALALVALPFAAPVVAVAALAIRATMGGPVIFRQSRIGRGGKSFQMMKLRTMAGSAGAHGAETTGVGDPRVTNLGRWLRRLHIDELPQLWHVLVGQMSFIGPRPEWTVLAEQYVEHLPVYAYRHLVRPGITGWAQVRSGYAADLRETKLKVAYDLFYVKHVSFALDLQILMRTTWIIVTGRGWR